MLAGGNANSNANGRGGPRALPAGRRVRHPLDDFGVWVLIAGMLLVTLLSLVSIVAHAFDSELFPWEDTTATTVVAE